MTEASERASESEGERKKLDCPSAEKLNLFDSGA